MSAAVGPSSMDPQEGRTVGTLPGGGRVVGHLDKAREPLSAGDVVLVDGTIFPGMIPCSNCGRGLFDSAPLVHFTHEYDCDVPYGQIRTHAEARPEDIDRYRRLHRVLDTMREARDPVYMDWVSGRRL